jgi:hypothetical protein
MAQTWLRLAQEEKNGQQLDAMRLNGLSRSSNSNSKFSD